MISRIAAVHSVAPIISDPIYGPKTLNSQLVNGLLVTSGMMPSAPGAVILNLPAHSNITIIPMLQTRKGIFRSATNAAIFVRTLFACDASADVVSVIKGLLHVMIHRCQILKADLNRDFRFGPLSRASYASPAPKWGRFPHSDNPVYQAVAVGGERTIGICYSRTMNGPSYFEIQVDATD